MPNNKIYNCNNCGAQYPKWQGRCTECGHWGSLTERDQEKNKKEITASPDSPVSLNDISGKELDRLSTNISELDRVLGGGIVLGSFTLLGGDPGVGKSTLALQIANQVKGCLYISGEESAHQIKSRAERIKTNLNNFNFLNQTNIEKIIATLKKEKPKVVIIDSIQTINDPETGAGLNSTAKITAVGAKLLETAKQENIPIIIIGHITKDGIIAGPKTLEHLVDTVLYLENDAHQHYKILRSNKNRFGSTGEIGLFEMTGSGLNEIPNPTGAFLENQNSKKVGSSYSAVIEGSRTFIIEIQALTAKAGFGYPQRKSAGIDLNRLQMIIAVLGKIGNINLSMQDIYINIAGGLKIKDPAIDLAIAAAILSAFFNLPIDSQNLLIGEIGLSGDIRKCSQQEKRMKEAKRLGFKNIIANDTAHDNRVRHVENIKQLIEIVKR